MKYKILIVLFFTLIVNAQKSPTLIIDGAPTSFESDISLPYWLSEGKTIDLGVHAISLSVIEFNIINNELQFNQVINLTSGSTVGLGLNTNDSGISINSFSSSETPSIFTSPQTFTSSATWIVPPGVTNICIEAWGKGGKGGDGLPGTSGYVGYGGAGGGGAYGYDCFSVTPGTVLNIIIGDDGSFVNNLILAEAGGDGENYYTSNPAVPAARGLGGDSSAAYNISGETPLNNSTVGGQGGNGGLGGGPGGNGLSATSGEFPGGGGGPGCSVNGGSNYLANPGRAGGGGQVKIYF